MKGRLKIVDDTSGIISDQAARNLGEYVVEQLKKIMWTDGRFKDAALQAEFEEWQKTPEAAMFE